MNFSEQSPSKQWAALKYRGEKVAEVWFKPEGAPFALTFRIPRSSFQLPGIAQRLTTETLLKAAGIATPEVESWHHEGAAWSDILEPGSEFGHPLPRPAQDVPHLTLHVRLKPPVQVVAPSWSGETEVPEPEPAVQAVAPNQSNEPEVPERKWQDLEARWNAILGLEATMDTLRISLEGLRLEMEGSSRKTLASEEKVHALGADVAQWNKAKSRILYVLPKVKEYIHRSTWVAGTPERKKLEELFKNHIQPRIPFPGMDQVMERLESLLKDRQVLSAHGMSVYQECKGVSEDVQRALRNLQNNAAANAARKRAESSAGGKFFKDIRRLSGA